MADVITPMMQQYQRLRGSVPTDVLLLFRLGDFYELFFEDAKEAAGLLNVALTKRNGVPMCGVPYHAAQNYIAKLIKAGRRVAICDQTSEPQPGRIVTRDITQIISAGTVSELGLLEPKRANYLGAIYKHESASPARTVFGFAYADLTTGEFRLMELRTQGGLADELARIGPSEILVSEEQRDIFASIELALAHDSYAFLPEQATFTLCEHFKTKSLDGFGCAGMPAAIGAAGAIKSIRDVERAAGRLSQASGNARDLVTLKNSLQQIPELKAELGKLIERINFGRASSPVEAGVSPATFSQDQPARLPLQIQSHRSLANRLQNEIAEMPELAAKLQGAVVDDAPLALKEGGIFRDGFDAQLDEFRNASRDGKNWINALQEREIAATGIKSLKVRFNSVFGYFIEITKSNLANVPERYIRKQTTVGGERFITPELKEMESKILGADEKARQLEYQLFQTLREETLRELEPIQQTAAGIGTLDVICALAETARL